MFRKYYWLLPLFFLALIAFFSFNNSAVAQGPMGGPGAADQKLVEKFDLDKKGYLNSEERKTARSFLETEQKNSNRRRRRRRRAREAGKPGPKVSPNDVKNFPELSLYDPKAFRTLFLEFEDDDWEKQLEIFKATDIEIPAIMKVDGKDYPNVGVSFRGASSFFMIPEGLKRSLNLSIDFIDNKQRMYDYKSLNLLNCNGDPTMMSSALYSYLCSQKIPTPKVNFVKVVINGESWGVYVSSQQFNKVFAKENFGESSGARWKVSGSPRGDGGLRYLGTDVAEYKKRFDIKSKDKQESWNDLINLCEVLNETPLEKLQAELEPILDIDGLLWFLAVDVVTANSDGYWTRASDFSIYQDSKGKFHILPHDMNEAFQVRHGRGGPGGGPRRGPPGFGPPPQRGGGERGGGERGGGERGGGERGGGERGARGGQRGGPGGGAGGGGIHLDPLIGLGNDRMPLRSRLLNVPELRVRYLENVRTLAEILRWETIGPKVKEMRDLIQDEVEKDTRKLSSTEDFIRATSDDTPGEGSNSLRSFAEQRAKFLLDHPKIKALTESENKK